MPGATAPDLTRQLCNVWKADRVLAEVVLARQVGEFAARLGGAAGRAPGPGQRDLEAAVRDARCSATRTPPISTISTRRT